MLSFNFATSELEKSNFYTDLEGVMEWEESKKTTDKARETDREAAPKVMRMM